jgi:hypothetical protein
MGQVDLIKNDPKGGGLGHPKGFALFYPCWGGIGDDMSDFMVYLYHRSSLMQTLLGDPALTCWTPAKTGGKGIDSKRETIIKDHPKGFALFYPCWGGIGDDMSDFMVYLYHRSSFGAYDTNTPWNQTYHPQSRLSRDKIMQTLLGDPALTCCFGVVLN